MCSELGRGHSRQKEGHEQGHRGAERWPLVQCGCNISEDGGHVSYIFSKALFTRHLSQARR